jgi:3-hydroxyisobutyrate dehydrogenase
MQKVALLGLGIMGSGFASNLLQKGFDLTVYNRTLSKAEALKAQGAKVGATPREAAEGADVVMAVLGDDTASRETWLGENGALSSAKPDAILIECSTLTPDWVRELARLAEKKGCKFIDAPIAGSKQAAATAQVGLFLGGEPEVTAEAQPVFDAISRRQVYMGAVGSASTWKLINNMILAVHTAALGEALALAEAAGVNMEQAVQLITNGAGSSFIVQNKLPRMIERQYEDTDFALKWMQKDAGYAVKLGESLGVSLNTVQGAWEAFQLAREQGLDDLDFAAVVEGLRKHADH